jgi:hypothetical protein
MGVLVDFGATVGGGKKVDVKDVLGVRYEGVAGLLELPPSIGSKLFSPLNVK